MPACSGMSFEIAGIAQKTWRFYFLAGVVKNNSHRVPVTGVQSANPVPHIHPIDAARSVHGALARREHDRLALRERDRAAA